MGKQTKLINLTAVLVAAVAFLSFLLVHAYRAGQAAPVAQLSMEWKEVTASGVNSEEKVRIISYVDTFEQSMAQRDADKVLSFFSAPENDEEHKELDFIRSSDIVRDAAKSSARLFSTAGYNYILSAHYLRAVAAQGANIRVLVDELRVIPSGGEWAGYTAQVAHLVIELRETPHGYQIVRYYHENASENTARKYEGFIAQ